jgi:mannuronan synthase
MNQLAKAPPIAAKVEAPLDQRQFARYQLPLRCVIDGAGHEVLDWSTGGFAVTGYRGGSRPGEALRVQLIFPFSDYSLMMTVLAEVRSFEQATGRLGLRFKAATDNQTNVLRYMIDAYLSGEIMNMGDVIEVSARKSDSPARADKLAAASGTKRRIGETIRRFAGAAVIMGVTLGLIGYVALGIYQRLYVRNAMLASVDIETVVIGAPIAGALTSLTTSKTVKQGEPIATVTDRAGVQSVVTSPCACLVVGAVVKAGSSVSEGQPLIRLAETAAKPFILATVDPDTLMALYRGAVAHMQYLDGTESVVRLDRFPPQTATNGGVGHAGVGIDVKIAAGRDDLAADMVGNPVRVWFDLSGRGLSQ